MHKFPGMNCAKEAGFCACIQVCKTGAS